MDDVASWLIPQDPCLANFVIQSRITCPGNGTAHSGQPLLLQFQIKAIPYRYAYRQSVLVNLSNEIPFSGESRLSQDDR